MSESLAVLSSAPFEHWALVIDAVNGLNSRDYMTRLFALAVFAWLLGPALLPLLLGLVQGHPFCGGVASIVAASVSLLAVPVASLAYPLIGDLSARLLGAVPPIASIGATVIMEVFFVSRSRGRLAGR
jgi:hypothetical protein